MSDEFGHLEPQDWAAEDFLRVIFFQNRGKVAIKEVDVLENQDLFTVVKVGSKSLLNVVNEEQRAKDVPEVILSGNNLSMLCHPGWPNMTYSDLLMLAPSKGKGGKRLIVIRSENPCK